jgi:hypothetical protein
MDRPLIADMRSKQGNTPRGSMVSASDVKTADYAESKAGSPVAGASVSGEPRADAPTSAAKEPELTPAERYRQRLESAKISLNEAHAIYDAVLDKGYYEEYVKIRDHRAVFRTRQYDDQLRLQTALETIQPKSAMAHEELISRYNLASSLFEWRAQKLTHDSEADFEKVLGLIRRLPQPLAAMLYDALAKFDNKVMIVFSEGCTDSF